MGMKVRDSQSAIANFFKAAILIVMLNGWQFMQRKQQADLVAQQLKEEASQREAAHWVVSNPQAAMIPPTYSHRSRPSLCFTPLSMLPLVNAHVVHRAVVADEQVVTGVRSGRMSFGQFNPSIEVRLRVVPSSVVACA
jgi:hypothetical protein